MTVDPEVVRAVLTENFVGPITDEIVERLTEHVRRVMADKAALGWEVLAFDPGNGRRGFGYRWREVLSFDQGTPRPIDLVFTIWDSDEPYLLERPGAAPLPQVIVVAEPEPPARVVSEFTTAALTAHLEWIARGRRGPGRLVIENASVVPLGMGVAKLGGARLVRVKFFNHKVDFADLSEAELVECVGQGTNVTHSIFDGATLERCTFENSHFGLTDFKDGRILGGSFRGSTADRGLWNRVRIRGADLRSFRFGDCVLDGAVLEDGDLRDADLHCITPALESLCSTLNVTFLRCDLRGANIDQLRFDNTRFVDCKLHGLIGAPRLEGPQPYTLENCDFSAAGDGSDLRTSL